MTEEKLTGAPDPQLLHQVQIEERILLTMDKGIADIRRYPPREYAGIVLLRPHRTGRLAVMKFIRQHLSSVLAAEVRGVSWWREGAVTN